MEFIGSIFWFLVALGLLITFHEYGHFWVARRMGVRVLRFSVGFGRPLWRRVGQDGTEYVVAAIPLGGYVKMLDEREAEVPDHLLDQAFNRKPVWPRIAIVAAGPIFNLIFAVAAFWLMFMIGISDNKPIIGEVSGIAETSGLEYQQQIVAIDDQPVGTWTHAIMGLLGSTLDRNPVTLTLQDPDGREVQRVLALDRLPDQIDEERILETIGIQPWRLPLTPVIGEVPADGPAAAAGVQVGDEIASIAGQPVSDWNKIGPLIDEHGRAGQPLAVEVWRNDRRVSLEITPRQATEGANKGNLIIGVGTGQIELTDEQRAELEHAFTLLRYGPVAALGQAVRESWRITSTTLGMLARMVTGKASLKNISGPISIARLANDSARLGLTRFLFFLGLISLSLAILNLLPIPVLDGGHLMYYLIELVKGTPVSERTQIAGQYVGLLLLAGLMSMAFINDILRLMP